MHTNLWKKKIFRFFFDQKSGITNFFHVSLPTSKSECKLLYFCCSFIFHFISSWLKFMYRFLVYQLFNHVMIFQFQKSTFFVVFFLLFFRSSSFDVWYDDIWKWFIERTYRICTSKISLSLSIQIIVKNNFQTSWDSVYFFFSCFLLSFCILLFILMKALSCQNW